MPQIPAAETNLAMNCAVAVRSERSLGTFARVSGDPSGDNIKRQHVAGLDVRQAQHLISYAVQQASGVPYWQRDAEHVENAFDFGGMVVRNGVLAAAMVSAGFSGVEGVLIDENGLTPDNVAEITAVMPTTAFILSMIATCPMSACSI